MIRYSRREWMKQAALAQAGFLMMRGLSSCCQSAKDIKTILVVSGWQAENIGDVAHTPGLLNILQTFLPDTNIILWKANQNKEVQDLIEKYFPKVKIVYGSLDKDYNAKGEEILEAFEQADIFIHGSGPGVDRRYLLAWKNYSDKPYGAFGVTVQHIDEVLKDLLEKAAFVFTRETDSLKVLEKSGITGANILFGPDATFYMDIRNDEKADRFLAGSGLEEKKFICVIPRLRYTPYHTFKKVNWTDEKIREVEETNEIYKEADHAKLREAIVVWVRETGNKVLVCPEMTYEVNIMDELVIDPLPEDVKPMVIKRGYWMPDEAASVYRKAHTLLSFECHSPIMALHNGTPMFYLRQPQDTIKGQMFYDLGFSDWVFEIEESTGKDISDQLREVWTDYPGALRRVDEGMKQVEEIYKKDTSQLKQLF